MVHLKKNMRHGESDWFGKLGVKSVRLVGKFSQCRRTILILFHFIMRTIHIFRSKAIKLVKHAFGN